MIDPERIQQIMDENPPFQVTSKGHEAMDERTFSNGDIETMMNKGCDLTIATVEVSDSEHTTIVHLVSAITFPVFIRGERHNETWLTDVFGESRRNPKDKANLTIGVLLAYQDALTKTLRQIDRRAGGELKHAEDCAADRKRRLKLKKKAK